MNKHILTLYSWSCSYKLWYCSTAQKQNRVPLHHNRGCVLKKHTKKLEDTRFFVTKIPDGRIYLLLGHGIFQFTPCWNPTIFTIFLTSRIKRWYKIKRIFNENFRNRSTLFVSTCCKAGVPKLSLAMYPFSISIDEHVPRKLFITTGRGK